MAAAAGDGKADIGESLFPGLFFRLLVAFLAGNSQVTAVKMKNRLSVIKRFPVKNDRLFSMLLVAVDTFTGHLAVKPFFPGQPVADFFMAVQAFPRRNPFADGMTYRTVVDAGQVLVKGGELAGGQQVLQDILFCRAWCSCAEQHDNAQAKKEKKLWGAH